MHKASGQTNLRMCLVASVAETRQQMRLSDFRNAVSRHEDAVKTARALSAVKSIGVACELCAVLHPHSEHVRPHEEQRFREHQLWPPASSKTDGKRVKTHKLE